MADLYVVLRLEPPQGGWWTYEEESDEEEQWDNDAWVAKFIMGDYGTWLRESDEHGYLAEDFQFVAESLTAAIDQLIAWCQDRYRPPIRMIMNGKAKSRYWEQYVVAVLTPSLQHQNGERYVIRKEHVYCEKEAAADRAHLEEVFGKVHWYDGRKEKNDGH